MKKSAHRFAAPLLASLALVAVATPASAQVANAAYRPASMSKSEAILGGAPSALAAITAMQGGRSLAPVIRPAVMTYSRTPVSSDRPDIFNSVALAIGHSSLDARWDRVANAGVGGPALHYAASLRGRDPVSRLEAVNSYVNARVRFVDDRVQFGVSDRWLAASETLARGRGDCEDFAIAKRAMLRAAGFADRDLYLVVLKDLTRRADHAVLVVRANGRFLVLDNGTDRIVDSSDAVDYKPILTFTAGASYTLGYRRETVPPVYYASNQVTLAGSAVEPAYGERDLPAVVVETASLVPTTVSL
jgi:predicted transglutaminase-like cysteine proteinase